VVLENHPCHNGCYPFLLKIHVFSSSRAIKAKQHNIFLERMETTKNKIKCHANIKEKKSSINNTKKKNTSMETTQQKNPSKLMYIFIGSAFLPHGFQTNYFLSIDN